ncbi:MAG: prenyltransferase [Actinomycetota bacterium]
MKALKALLISSRPISWVNTAFPFFLAYWSTTGRVDETLILGTIFFLIPYNLLMYGINDVFDYESDLRNPRKGGIEGALLDKKYHTLMIWVSLGLTFGFMFLLIPRGDDVATMFLMVSVLSVLAYSVPRLRFKEKPFLDSFTSALHFVGPMVYGLALGSADFGNIRISIVIAAFMLWGIASHAFGAVQDVKADREAGIGSVATEIGAKGAVQFSFGAYLASGLLLLTIGWPGSLAAAAVLPYLAIIFPYLKIEDSEAEKANRGWRKFIFLNFLAGAIVTMIVLDYLK